MGYSRDYLSKPQLKKRPWKVHPIWRGIGCILIILIPILAYAAADLLVERNVAEHWVPAPGVLMQTVEIPFLNLPTAHLYANLMVAGILMIVAYAALMILYSIVYSLVGPPQLGPLDAEPMRGKRK
jgi:hypothetical protein